MGYTNLINPEILNNMVADYAYRHKLGHLIVGKDNDRCKLIKPFETASAVVEYMNKLVPGFASINMANEFTNSIVTLDQLEALLEQKFGQLALRNYNSVTYNVPLVPGQIPPGGLFTSENAVNPVVNSNGELYLTTGSGSHNFCFAMMLMGTLSLLKGFKISLYFKCNGNHYHTMCLNSFALTQKGHSHASDDRQHIAVPTNVSEWTSLVIESTNPSILNENYNKAYYNGSVTSLSRTYPPSGYVNYLTDAKAPAMIFPPVSHGVYPSMDPDQTVGFNIAASSYGSNATYYKHLYVRDIVITMYTDDMPAFLDSLGYEIPNPVFGYSKIN